MGEGVRKAAMGGASRSGQVALPVWGLAAICGGSQDGAAPGRIQYGVHRRRHRLPRALRPRRWDAGGAVTQPIQPFALVTLPIRTVNELNDHKHWRTRQKRAKAQRSTTLAHMLALATRTRIPTGRSATTRARRSRSRRRARGRVVAAWPPRARRCAWRRPAARLRPRRPPEVAAPRRPRSAAPGSARRRQPRGASRRARARTPSAGPTVEGRAARRSGAPRRPCGGHRRAHPRRSRRSPSRAPRARAETGASRVRIPAPGRRWRRKAWGRACGDGAPWPGPAGWVAEDPSDTDRPVDSHRDIFP